jgi:hypothetical protein
MSTTYEEVLAGEVTPRRAPGARHELICSRLHMLVEAGIANLVSTRLLPARTRVLVSPAIQLCPDLSLVVAATGKLWLAAEIVNADDHRTDTVVKKQIYEDIKVPRLWMVDPRYDNLEVYHATEYGLKLVSILAGREVLTEKLLPRFELKVDELFVPKCS